MSWFECAGSAQAVTTACLVGVALGTFSYRLRVLDVSGALGVAAIAILVLTMSEGRWEWVIPMATFFVVASGLTVALGSGRVNFEGDDARRGRTLAQVIANGGPATLCLLGAALWPHRLWYLSYLAALAAVNADTWATEFGTRWGGTPRSLLSWGCVPVGRSGGVTRVGTLAAAVGALFIATCGAVLDRTNGWAHLLGVTAIAGWTGAFIDSLLGATVQAVYYCDRCQRLTERPVHCNAPGGLHSGFATMTTHWVNFLCGASGAAIAALLAIAV